MMVRLQATILSKSFASKPTAENFRWQETIEEADIKEFLSELQDQMRDTIGKIIEKKYQLRHLALAKNGMVRLDYEQIEMDVDSAPGPLSAETYRKNEPAVW